MQRNLEYERDPDPEEFYIKIWAPSLDQTPPSIIVKTERDTTTSYPMAPAGDGNFTCKIRAYADMIEYRLALADGRQFPDPFSLENQGGVHGWSVARTQQTHNRPTIDWRGVPVSKAMIMEVHIGTFSQEGTFKGCIEKLDDVAALGINILQLMPIWLTPGDRNWGYDPVSFFTLNSNYGSLADFQMLIDAAHVRGIAIVIDCVFNHLGPEGNYFSALDPQLLSKDHTTPWGDILNLDVTPSCSRREIIFHSIDHWVGGLGVDGIRVDAGEYLRPGGDIAFLLDLAKYTRDQCCHDNPLLFLEYDLYQLTPPALSALIAPDRYDRLWNRSLLSTRPQTEEVFAKIAGALKTITLHDDHLNITPSGAQSENFISFLRSHDTIGNSGKPGRNAGEDKRDLLDYLRLLLLAPSTPMIFMGDEWLSDTPFHFFCRLNDVHEDDLIDSRAREFPSLMANCPSPFSPEAFVQSKLQWPGREQNEAADILDTIKELIAIRRTKLAGFLSNPSHLIEMDVNYKTNCAWVSWETDNGSRLHFTICRPSSASKLPGFPGTVIYSHILNNKAGDPLFFKVVLQNPVAKASLHLENSPKPQKMRNGPPTSTNS